MADTARVIDFNDRKVSGLKPDGARREYRDAKYPLYVVVQPSGARTFQFRGKRAGQSFRKALGTYSAMGLSEARTQALALKLLKPTTENSHDGRG